MTRFSMFLWRKAGILIALGCLAAVPATGQVVNQSARFEKPYKYADGIYSVMPMGEEGLLLLRDKERYESGKKIWEVQMLDTNLEEVKTVELKVENRNRLLGYEYQPGKMFLLFREGETEKADLELIEVRRDGDDHPRYNLKPELPLHITHFSVVGSGVVLGGYVNKEPSIVLFDLQNESLRVLPGFFQTDTELVDLRVNVNNTFNVVLIERSQRDSRKVVFQTYDERGDKLLEDIVSIKNRVTLQTGFTSNLNREDLIVTGTWGQGNSKQSNGFYFLPVNPFAEQEIKLVAFGQLQHFLDYQKEGRAARIREKTEVEMKQSEIPNFVSYVMPFRLVEYEKGFILFAELYNPSSTFSNYSGPYSPSFYNPYFNPYGWYPGYGRMYSRPYSYGYNSRRIDEVKTYQSVVLSFDPDGKVMWDFSLNLDDVKQSSLDQVADFHYANNQVTFLFRDESELKIKNIVLDEDEPEFVAEKIKTLDPGDEIRSERDVEGGVRYWYGDAFYVWGYQTLRNPNNEERIRDVFYINKVEIR